MCARPARTAALLAVAVLASGCYAGRTVWGGARLLARRQPVGRLLADAGTPPELRRRLETAAALRAFAAGALALPVGRSYTGFVELERPYVTWTVTAAPELSVEPLVWCFPIAGCVSYRGYFSAEGAERFAARLRRRGLEVEIGGVRAYSTLGRFRDPLLSSFIELPEPELAGLLFHELAHRRLYVKGDTTFNESFASVVEEEGVRRWLLAAGRPKALDGWLAARHRDEQVIELALATRARLAEAYAAPRNDDWKRVRKRELLDELRAAYRARRGEWGDRWDRFFDADLGNARLASLGAYQELVPELRRLLAAEDGHLERFYAAAEALASLTPEERRGRLTASAETGS